MFVELQPMTKVRIAKDGSWACQPRSEWLDVTHYTGGVFYIDVEEVTAWCEFELRTSFGEMVGAIPLVNIVAPGSTVYSSNPNDPSLPLLARNVFWYITAFDDNVEITFRVRAMLKHF